MYLTRAILRLSLLAVIATGCGTLPNSITIDLGSDAPDVNAIVQATFQALTIRRRESGLRSRSRNRTAI